MKVLVNWKESICNDCGQRECAVDYAGDVICSFCGSKNLKNKYWNQFVPKWKQDARNSIRLAWSHHMRRATDHA